MDHGPHGQRGSLPEPATRLKGGQAVFTPNGTVLFYKHSFIYLEVCWRLFPLPFSTVDIAILNRFHNTSFVQTSPELLVGAVRF